MRGRLTPEHFSITTTTREADTLRAVIDDVLSSANVFTLNEWEVECLEGLRDALTDETRDAKLNDEPPAAAGGV